MTQLVPKEQPRCGCDRIATLVTGRSIYPDRPDLASRNFYVCRPCKTIVGCHPGTTKPLGTLADWKTRQARLKLHNRFDPIWRSGRKKRQAAYDWLADLLGIPRSNCHFGMFDLETCERAMKLLDDAEKDSRETSE